VADSIF